jgi:hypothetical protein
MESQWDHKIFAVTDGGFETLALEIFHYQYEHNSIYRDYVNALRINAAEMRSIIQIPFLPIRFFKSHNVCSNTFEPSVIFKSSGTTTTTNSRHLIKDTWLYKASFMQAFELAYGNIRDWCVIGLLPSYLERQGSSLIYMVNELINESQHPNSGFYLDEHEKLYALLAELEREKQKTLLIGVTFALLDFAEKYSLPLHHTTIMETGGMKGRRKEMIRAEVHEILRKSFGSLSIHSEYGMTELLSQAYSKGEGIFHCPPWMKIIIRDDEDPLSIKTASNKPVSGAINVIDLCNVHSCSFIATDDAGKLYPGGGFEVLGRIDNSDLRGCSLLTI